jgi:hypothetical protein
MAISFVVAIFFEVINPNLGLIDIPENQAYLKLVYSVSITTVGWLLVTFLTQPEKDEILLKFYRKVHPAAFGWKKVLDRYPEEKQEIGQLPKEIGLMLIGSIMIYSALFATGFWLYGESVNAMIATLISVISGGIVLLSWRNLR